MRILAADYGDARTGLAVCDSNETIASPIGNAQGKGEGVLPGFSCSLSRRMV